MAFKAFKYRVYLTKDQEITLINWLGQTRFTWNYFLSECRWNYEFYGKFLSKFDMSSRLPALKKKYTWMNGPAHSYLNKIFDLQTAIDRFMDPELKAEFPKYKSKYKDKSGIKINQISNHIYWNEKQIQIPKLGLVKFKYHRPISGTCKGIIIKREANQWYVVILCEVVDIQPVVDFSTSECIGLDFGLKDFYTSSNNEVVDTPKYYRKSLNKLKKKQRQLSRKKKGSNNREKARKRLAILHLKVRNQRKNFHQQTANSITKNYSVVFVETLNLLGMAKNHKWSKAVYDQGWGNFLLILKYALYKKGGHLHKINQWEATTQTCSSCGHKHKLDLSERTFVCPNCGLSIQRDHNAGINIKQTGIKEIDNTVGTTEIKIYACQDTSYGEVFSDDETSNVSLKQEAAILLG